MNNIVILGIVVTAIGAFLMAWGAKIESNKSEQNNQKALERVVDEKVVSEIHGLAEKISKIQKDPELAGLEEVAEIAQQVGALGADLDIDLEKYRLKFDAAENVHKIKALELSDLNRNFFEGLLSKFDALTNRVLNNNIIYSSPENLPREYYSGKFRKIFLSKNYALIMNINGSVRLNMPTIDFEIYPLKSHRSGWFDDNEEIDPMSFIVADATIDVWLTEDSGQHEDALEVNESTKIKYTFRGSFKPYEQQFVDEVGEDPSLESLDEAIKIVVAFYDGKARQAK